MDTSEERARDIFLAALDEDPNGWSTFLDQACGDDETVRQQVEKMLRAHQATDSLLDEPAPWHAITSEQPGDQIGPYTLRERLGAGGMGVVWMAEQHEPLRRDVALKVIRPGMDGKHVLTRFEAELETLAKMEHSNVARALDAGTTEEGRPYFVMELIRGEPISKYCDQRHLETRERLELFIDVCRGVQHAHQKAILHRDLKPSNILVAEEDGRPAAKVIDFGVAKALEPMADRAETPIGIDGTFAYMSPEQARGEASQLDTRSDVYALGVVLHQLLAGELPYDLPREPFSEIVRIITTVNPRKLSQSDASYAGDIEAIALKALEKDPSTRYATVQDLIRDIRRHLDNEPVEARECGLWERGRKWSRRNRAAAATISVVVVSAILFLGLAAWSYIQISAARELEKAEREKAEETLAHFGEIIFLDLGKIVNARFNDNRFDEVIELSDVSVRAFGLMVRQAPDHLKTKYRLGLGNLHGIRSSAYMQSQNKIRAAEEFKETVEIFDRLLRDNPGNAYYRSYKAFAMNDYGIALKRNFELSKAMDIFNDALALRPESIGGEEPGMEPGGQLREVWATLMINKADVLILLDRRAAAQQCMSNARELAVVDAKLHTPSASTLVKLAELYARSSRVYSTEKRREVLNLALDVLEEAVELGFTDAAAIESSFELLPVRGEDRFQELLKRLKP